MMVHLVTDFVVFTHLSMGDMEKTSLRNNLLSFPESAALYKKYYETFS